MQVCSEFNDASALWRSLYWDQVLHITNKDRYQNNERLWMLALLNSPLLWIKLKFSRLANSKKTCKLGPGHSVIIIRANIAQMLHTKAIQVLWIWSGLNRPLSCLCDHNYLSLFSKFRSWISWEKTLENVDKPPIYLRESSSCSL